MGRQHNQKKGVIGKKCKNNITLEVSDLQNPQKMVLLDHIQHFYKLPYLGALGGWQPQKKGLWWKKKIYHYH